MDELLQNPAIQAGVAPFAAALVVATVLARTRFAWLAIVAGYAAMVALTTGFAFAPLSASRKVLLLVLLAPLLGLALDLVAPKARRAVIALALASGAAALWAFATVLVQRDPLPALASGGLVAACTAGLVWLTTRLRADGVAAGAAGLGLGVAAGVSALLSASIGYLMSGIAIAAASGAMLLVQVVARRAIPPGLAGTLSLGVSASLVASATLMIAKLPWYALPLMLAIPAAASLFAGGRLPLTMRALLAAAVSIAAAALPVAAAWIATLGESP